MAQDETVAVIDYGLGNVRSIVNMFKKVGVRAVSTSDPRVLRSAARLVLPGVGSFDAGVANLRDLGIRPLLDDLVLGAGVPLLGICLGMQLLAESSEEGQLPGLGWIAGRAVRFRFDGEDRGLRVPHMGWNQVHAARLNPLVPPGGDQRWFYFAHSYHVACEDPRDPAAKANYGTAFNAVVHRGNICGVQFHPEKSHRYGMELLKNFAGFAAARRAEAA